MAKANTRTLKLLNPITITTDGDESTIDVLEFRKPKAKDFRVRDRASGDVDATIRIMANLTDQTVQVIDELESDDFNAASEIVADFMGASPKTGET